MIWRLLLLLAIGLLGACARTPVLVTADAQLPERVELNQVPFFPQDDYQCGPAALATMLTQRGIETSPDKLVSQVYIPGRRGSLQVEMVAAARSHGLLVYPLEPRLETLLAEVAAGNPVLVLQNLAFDRWPQWHFAVVVGYDLSDQTIVLRSGTTKRRVTGLRQFERTWLKGERWAVVTVQPNQLPVTAQETVWLQAASDLEQTGQPEAARKAYEAASAHWAGALSWFALGNSRYAQGDHSGAEQALRTSISRDASFAPGWFNLSHVLAERGCASLAQKAHACAARLAPEDKRFVIEATAAPAVKSSCGTLLACPAL